MITSKKNLLLTLMLALTLLISACGVQTPSPQPATEQPEVPAAPEEPVVEEPAQELQKKSLPNRRRTVVVVV